MPQKKTGKNSLDVKLVRKTRQYRLLKSVASLLLRTGPTKLELLKLLTIALDELSDLNTESSPWLSDDGDLDYSIGDVIQAWHRQPRFMDEKATPLPLPLLGEKLSVQALVKEFCPTLDSTDVVKEMLKSGLLKRSGKGKYVPSKLQVIYRGAHPLTLINACRTAIRFMGTIDHNVNSRDKDSLYVERVTHVTRLPSDKLRAFLDLAAQQSKLLMTTTNDWLESNSDPPGTTKRPKSKHVEAGIHVFTFSSTKKT
jgi:hypothetical protein